jgi:hypothetical protein
VLRHGISIKEAAEARLAGKPTAIWSLTKSDKSYIVLAFLNASMILEVGAKVEELQSSNLFESRKPTIHASIMNGDLIV